METISIDIEPYSGNDLNKCGMYKYVQHSDFDILLFGYAVDGGEAHVVDLAAGEEIPEEILASLSEHDAEKWELFKFYNWRDVEVEQSIQKKLYNFPVPDFVWKEFWQDQEINDRGILLDLTFVEEAIALDEISKDKLSDAMKNITELDNPNRSENLLGMGIMKYCQCFMIPFRMCFQN